MSFRRNKVFKPIQFFKVREAQGPPIWNNVGDFVGIFVYVFSDHHVPPPCGLPSAFPLIHKSMDQSQAQTKLKALRHIDLSFKTLMIVGL